MSLLPKPWRGKKKGERGYSVPLQTNQKNAWLVPFDGNRYSSFPSNIKKRYTVFFFQSKRAAQEIPFVANVAPLYNVRLAECGECQKKKHPEMITQTSL